MQCVYFAFLIIFKEFNGRLNFQLLHYIKLLNEIIIIIAVSVGTNYAPQRSNAHQAWLNIPFPFWTDLQPQTPIDLQGILPGTFNSEATTESNC